MATVIAALREAAKAINVEKAFYAVHVAIEWLRTEAAGEASPVLIDEIAGLAGLANAMVVGGLLATNSDSGETVSLVADLDAASRRVKRKEASRRYRVANSSGRPRGRPKAGKPSQDRPTKTEATTAARSSFLRKVTEVVHEGMTYAVGLYRNPTDDALYVKLHNSQPEITASVGVHGEGVSASQALLELSARARKAKPRAGSKTTIPPPAFLEQKAKEASWSSRCETTHPAVPQNKSVINSDAHVGITEYHGIFSEARSGSRDATPPCVSPEENARDAKTNPSLSRNIADLFSPSSSSSSSNSKNKQEEEEDSDEPQGNRGPSDWYSARDANQLVSLTRRFIEKFPTQTGIPLELARRKLVESFGEEMSQAVMQNANEMRFVYAKEHLHDGSLSLWLFIAEEQPSQVAV
jgi:hypothetical protein